MKALFIDHKNLRISLKLNRISIYLILDKRTQYSLFVLLLSFDLLNKSHFLK